MNKRLGYLFKRYFEIAAFVIGLLLMALMDPYTPYEASWCFFENAGITFCPGRGLGHSIAFVFRADIGNALKANMMGPLAIIIIIFRIWVLLNKNFTYNPNK